MIAESSAIIGALERSLAMPTFGFLANWHDEYAVDVDEEAGRYLAAMLIDRIRRLKTDQIALILAARGGYPSFADTVLRTTRQIGVELHVVLAERVDGSISLLAAGANDITCHPAAGLGALDAGLCVVPDPQLDASLLPFLPGDILFDPSIDPGQEARLRRLAFDRFIREEQRRFARRLLSKPDLDPLLEAQLGRGGAATVQDLTSQGYSSRVASDSLCVHLEELLRWAQANLHFYSPPSARFQMSSEWTKEVEFEPATTIAAAAIIDAESAWVHELDTGSPDPHAPRLAGTWSLRSQPATK